MALFKKRRASSVLGLSLNANRLEAVVVRRGANDTLQVRESVSAALALSPLSGDPELVGREIRNQLDQAGIRERRCALSIPLNWALGVQTKLPELADADLKGYLELEAERGFPSGHENLYIGHSLSTNAAGERYATLLAVPRNHLETLEKVLRAAQLKPLTFALGAAAMDSPGRDVARGMITLVLGPHSLELAILAGGGIVALRSLDGAIETEGAQKHVDADLVAREIRITLGQLPADLTDGVRNARIFARGEFARQFVSDATPRIEAMGLRVETMDRGTVAQFDRAVPPETALTPALAVAAEYVLGSATGPEFLLPKTHPVQKFIETRLGSKRLGWATASAATVLVCLGAVFGWQEAQLIYWRNQMGGIEPQVKTVESVQNRIKMYRPWFDESDPTLRVLRSVAEAFSQNGDVTAKTLQIRTTAGVTEVSCAGVTVNSQAYRTMFNNLVKTPGVTNVIPTGLNGNPPTIQFGVGFQWNGAINGQ